MNFGIIGFGNIARKFVKSIEYTDEGIIYAIASHSLDIDDVYLKRNPLVQLYRSYDELLENQNIDAIYISLPHYEHKKWIIKAIEKGKPVLCEKPFVLNSIDIKDIEYMRKLHNGYYLEALKTKFNQAFFHLKEDIQLIGSIDEIYAQFCFQSNMDKRKNTYLFDEKQGGALNDVGSYLVGFILGLVSEDIAKIDSYFQIDKIDTYFCSTLIFKNNIKAFIEGAIDRKKERIASIYGKYGKIIVPNFNRIEEYQIIFNDGTILNRKYPIYGDDMTLEIQCFIDDIRNKKKESNFHNYKDMKKIIEVIERMREGKLYE